MGKNFRETLNERMQDPAFRTEWDAQEPERQIMRAIVEGREESGMTQKQLSTLPALRRLTSADWKAERPIPLCGRSSVLPQAWEWRSSWNSFRRKHKSDFKKLPQFKLRQLFFI